VGLIDLDPDQVRSRNDLEGQEFAELCANVAELGVLQPVLTRPGSRPGRYTLIAGEYRFEAARRARLATVPCYIEDAPLDPVTLHLQQLSENLHRQELPHLDLARAFHWLTIPVEQGGGGLRASTLARRLGRSQAFISEHRALLKLSAEEQKALEEGALSFDEARARLRTGKNPDRRATVKTAERESRRTRPGAEGLPANASASTGLDKASPSAPERLGNGHYVYGRYSGVHPESDLTVLVSGPGQEEPTLDSVVKAVERHLHRLKIQLVRQRHRVKHPDPGREAVLWTFADNEG
jgi:ParB family chromosome partitioning protein